MWVVTALRSWSRVGRVSCTTSHAPDGQSVERPLDQTQREEDLVAGDLARWSTGSVNRQWQRLASFGSTTMRSVRVRTWDNADNPGPWNSARVTR